MLSFDIRPHDRPSGLFSSPSPHIPPVSPPFPSLRFAVIIQPSLGPDGHPHTHTTHTTSDCLLSTTNTSRHLRCGGVPTFVSLEWRLRCGGVQTPVSGGVPEGACLLPCGPAPLPILDHPRIRHEPHGLFGLDGDPTRGTHAYGGQQSFARLSSLICAFLAGISDSATLLSPLCSPALCLLY